MPQSTTPRRWSEDTRIAFLLALRLTGGIRTAAAEIGRHVTTCYDARQRDAGFAAAWDGIVAAQKAARRVAKRRPDLIAPTGAAGEPGVVAGLMKPQARWDGVTPVKRRAFLRGLSETGSLQAACRTAGISDTAVQGLRERDADFAAAWERALKTAAPTLRQIAHERAVEGWDEPIFKDGKQVGVRRRYSERLLNTLLVEERKEAAMANDPPALLKRAQEAARAAGGEFVALGWREDTNTRMIQLLDKIERQHGLPPLEEDPEAVRTVFGEAGIPPALRDDPVFRADTDWAKVRGAGGSAGAGCGVGGRWRS